MSDPAREQPAAAILVGGASLRLGRDKALVRIGGVTLAERVRRAVVPVTKHIIVVGKAGERNPLPDLPFVTEAHPVRCALAGLVAALGAAGDRRVLVVGCDHPFLSPALLRVLSRPGDFTVRVVAGEPLLACWKAWRALPELERRLEDGVLSLQDAINALGPEIVSREQLLGADPELRSLRNINTPEDLCDAGDTHPPDEQTDCGDTPENY